MADNENKKFDLAAYYKDLARLFKSGPTFKQRVSSKVAAPGEPHAPVGTARAFMKDANGMYSNMMASYGQYCIDGDTEVWVVELCKSVTIKELSEKYKDKSFHVYAYDLENKKVVIAEAMHARKTKTDKTIKLTFDDNSFLICTPDHRILMRDGTYREAQNIKITESIMPLYRKDIYSTGYQFLVAPGHKGAVSEHKAVCEWKTGRQKLENEVVHHINHIKNDNTPENLVFMDEKEHCSMHGKQGAIIWESHRDQIVEKLKKSWDENYEERCKINKDSWAGREDRKELSRQFAIKHNEIFWTEENKQKHSATLSETYNTPEGKNKQSKRATEAWQSGKLVENKEFTNYWIGKKRSQEWKDARSGKANYNFKNDITLEAITEHVIKNNFARKETSVSLGCSNDTLGRRYKKFGFSDWNSFCDHVKKYNNHKLTKIEEQDVRDVYDLEVPGYNNFAIAFDGKPLIFIHNSRMARYSAYSEMESEALVASALDLLSEETCAKNEHGKLVKIESENPKIKNALTELFEDVLNIEFEAATWIRNICKYGDHFMTIDHHPDFGVLGVYPLPVNEIEIEHGYDKEDPLAFRYRWITQGNKSLEKWQVIHFRMPGNDQFWPYGASAIEPARRAFRQLCHASNTKVLIDGFGYKLIKDVLPGDKVISFDIENKTIVKTKVKHSIAMGKQKIVKVRTLHRQIDVTPNHGLLVYSPKEERFLYKQAKDLNVSAGNGGHTSMMSDKLVLPIDKSGFDDIKFEVTDSSKYYVKLKEKSNISRYGVVEKIKDCNAVTGHKNVHEFLQGRRKISYSDFLKVKTALQIKKEDCVFYWENKKRPTLIQPKEDTCLNLSWQPKNVESFVRFFGFMLGDGWISKKGTNLGFALGVHPEMNETYVSLLSELSENRPLMLQEAKKFRGGQINLPCQELSSIFKEAGFISGFAKKRIPSWVFTLNQKLRIGFIEGLMDADGCDTGKIELANEELVSQLQQLCYISGVPVGKVTKVTGKEKVIGGVKTKSKDSFYLHLNLKNKAENKEFILENVVSVEDSGEDETYDIEVDHQTHNFTANGIISHNTLMEDAVMLYRIVRSPERRVFYIGVGNIAPQDVPSYVEKAQTQLRRNQVVDGQGRVDLRLNPMNALEDFFIPIRGEGDGTRIEALPGGQFVGDIEDLTYVRDKLLAALKIPKAYLGYDDGLGNKSTLCIQLNTKIPLLDGRTLSLSEIIKEYEVGKKNYCYSVDTDKGKVIHGEIKWAGPTKKNAKVIRIWLDNGKYLDCTENHVLVSRGGTKKQAHEFKVGDSLMPLYRKPGMRNYEEVYHPGLDSYEFTHKAITQSSGKYIQGKVIYHIDGDKTNNTPDNLDCSMTWLEHRRFHQKHVELTLMRPDVIEQRKKDFADPNSNFSKWIKSDKHRNLKSIQMTGQWKNNDFTFLSSDQYKIDTSERMKKNWKRSEYRDLKVQQNKDRWNNQDFRKDHSGENHWVSKKYINYDFKWLVDYCKENKITSRKDFLSKAPIGSRFLDKLLKANCDGKWRNFARNYLNCRINHKIVKIEELNDSVDVGCLTIDNEFHNFAIDSGIFIGNSQIDTRFARTIQKIQRVLTQELNKIAIIHLYSMGFRGDELINFNIKMANPSMIAELQSLELWRTKFEVASLAQSGQEGATFDSYFVYKNIFKLSDEEIQGIEEGKRRDKLFQAGMEGVMGAPIEQAPEAGAAPVDPVAQPVNGAPPDPGLPPPPGEETGAPVESAKDPNTQSAAPSELINPGHSNSHKQHALPNLSQHATNTKKTSLDPQRGYSELMRAIKAPFGEEVDKYSTTDENLNKKISQLKRFAEDLENIPDLNRSKTKKVFND